MADHTSIEWTDATWNPVTGCSVVSAGCTNCYAMKLAGTRMKHHPSREGLTQDTKSGPVWNGQVRFNEQWLDQPLRWKRPRTIFVCAHGDLFHEGVPDEWIDRVFAVMALCPHHRFQVLTKRSGRAMRYAKDWNTPVRVARLLLEWAGDKLVAFSQAFAALIERGQEEQPEAAAWPLPNVWLGVSVEDQRAADERIPDLVETPAAVRFLSCEPLLGPVDLEEWLICANARDGVTMDPSTGAYECCTLCDFTGVTGAIGWVIVGGESGKTARPMHPAWARSLRDQCASASVPYFFKQWGEWAPVCEMSEEAIDACYDPAPEHDPNAMRRRKVAECVLHWNADRFEGRAMFERPAFEQGSKAMTMMAIGKKKSGRFLDGAQHDGMPS
ncbi:DUF5131 family protein [Stakelama pacifica]|uniref:Protein gp37 n=1 Tax=Stakelama pacifica TaxID=517720 RepID=A0A4R6FN37_9SPHN|nr:phage Gp37/Gp68 family protein [Stakelama pacifica]TDN83016.1 protein gp37 [Stakelama pacifica]GGO94924.1 hypothetical protein GCM10011329_17900 [Stakelama pacifica]